MAGYNDTVIEQGAEPSDVEPETRAELVTRPSAELVAAVERVRAFRQNTKAASTQRAYEGDWKRFQAWAAASGVPSLPAPPEAVSVYLLHLAEDGYSVAALERFLAAAAHYHRIAGFAFQRGVPELLDTLEAIRRKVGTKRTKKAPLGVKALAEICTRLQASAAQCDAEDRAVFVAQRAVLTTGWFCMLRSANLVSIRREHVRLVRFEGEEWIDDDARPEGLIVHLPSSKTDQRKEGRDVAVHAQEDEAICPVRAMADHLRARTFAPEDRIFPVSERTVTRLIKRLVANSDHGHKSLKEIAQCESCSAVARRFASHSLRRGAATTQAMKGVEERDIMRQGGWKSERVMRGYIEHATLFQNNPTKGLTEAPAAPPKKSSSDEWDLEAKAAHARILDGFYPDWLVDSFVQNVDGRAAMAPADVRAFNRLYTQWMNGELCLFHVEITSGPSSDQTANQRTLDTLPDIFSAKLLESGGQFGWRGAIQIPRAVAGSHREMWLVEPRRLPFEVGHTEARKTLEHVTAAGGVARWPQDYAMIVVLVAHPSSKMGSGNNQEKDG